LPTSEINFLGEIKWHRSRTRTARRTTEKKAPFPFLYLATKNVKNHVKSTNDGRCEICTYRKRTVVQSAKRLDPKFKKISFRDIFKFAK